MAAPGTAIAGGPDWARLLYDVRWIAGQPNDMYSRLRGKYEHNEPNFTLEFVKPPLGARISDNEMFTNRQKRLKVVMPWVQVGLPWGFIHSEIRKIAFCDFVTRVASDLIKNDNAYKAVPRFAAFNIACPTQEVLPRTSAMIGDQQQTIELLFNVTLPVADRAASIHHACEILGVNLVTLTRRSLLLANFDQMRLQQHMLFVEGQDCLRTQLASHGLVAFVANGSILPRHHGANALPLDTSTAVPFKSPAEMEVTLKCTDGTPIAGLGMPLGLTVIAGGANSGKSTLLKAIELGVYNHIRGDGRELVVTDPTAVRIRVEEGRLVSGLDLTPFSPNRGQSMPLNSSNASGFISTIANIQEALEAGCSTLLLDEDASATSLVSYDPRVPSLLNNHPVKPFIRKASALYTEKGVSTIVVTKALGEWSSIANSVIWMNAFKPDYATATARTFAMRHPHDVPRDVEYGDIQHRTFLLRFAELMPPCALSKSFIGLNPRSDAVSPPNDPGQAVFGSELSSLSQIVDVGQARMIAYRLGKLPLLPLPAGVWLDALLAPPDQVIGIDSCVPTTIWRGDLVAVRRIELAAAISRLRLPYATH